MATDREADLFAMYFLVPDHLLRKALKEIGWPACLLTATAIAGLADRFGVPTETMSRRLALLQHDEGTA